MPNPFVHVELHTKDLPAAKAFYSQLFAWKLEDLPMPDGQGTYTMINVGEGTGGGMFANPDPAIPPTGPPTLALRTSVAPRRRRANWARRSSSTSWKWAITDG